MSSVPLTNSSHNPCNTTAQSASEYALPQNHYGTSGQQDVLPARHSAIAIPSSSIADEVGGVWASGLKECYKQPKYCALAAVWPCGLAAKIAKGMISHPSSSQHSSPSPSLGTLSSPHSLGPTCRPEARSRNFIPTSTSIFTGKLPGSHWSTAAHIMGALFVLGMWRLRIKTQDYYGIRRRKFFDIYATLFCTRCSLARMSKQVDFERTKAHNYQLVQQSAYSQSGHVDTIPAFRQ